jgi:PPP family 3-phenylpropionic acid transporter
MNASYWMMFCAIYGFANFYMLEFGLISSQIGVILAIGNISAFFLQPLTASFADRTKRFSLNQLILAILFIFLIALMILGFLTTQKYMIGAMFAVLIAMLFVLQPLINSISGNFESHGISINFGIARSMGSLFYAFASYGIGILITLAQPKIVLLVSAMFVGFLFISTIFFQIPSAKKENEFELASGLLGFFKDYPNFIGVFLGVACIFFFHTSSNVYMYQILSRYGGNSSDLGITLGIAAIFEVPTMFLFSKFAKRFQPSTLFKISGFFYVIKSIILLSANTVILIQTQQILQAFSFALFTPASVEYVNQSVAPKDRVKGQAFITTANTLGATLSTLIGGAMLTSYGVHTMLLIASIVVSSGFVILLLFVTNPIKHKKRRIL